MNRAKVVAIREALNRLILASNEPGLAGLSVRVGNARFSSSNVTFKVEVAEVSSAGEVLDSEAEAFKSRASFFGLSPNDLGKTFTTFGGEEFRIVGLRPRAPKRPIIGARTKDGKRFVFTTGQVEFALKARKEGAA